MGEDEESYLPALAIMRKWQWTFNDPDGFPRRLGLDLSEVVNRLAMEGQPSPHLAVLDLLCRQRIFAFGHFKWMKFQWGKHFQLEDFNAQVTAKQWQALRAAREKEQAGLADFRWPVESVDLHQLEMNNCPCYEWEYEDNRFSFALCPPDIQVHDEAYFEEWFSAWEIDIRFPDNQIDAPESEPTAETIKGLFPAPPEL